VKKDKIWSRIWYSIIKNCAIFFPHKFLSDELSIIIIIVVIHDGWMIMYSGGGGRTWPHALRSTNINIFIKTIDTLLYYLRWYTICWKWMQQTPLRGGRWGLILIGTWLFCNSSVFIIVTHNIINSKVSGIKIGNVPQPLSFVFTCEIFITFMSYTTSDISCWIWLADLETLFTPHVNMYSFKYRLSTSC